MALAWWALGSTSALAVGDETPAVLCAPVKPRPAGTAVEVSVTDRFGSRTIPRAKPTAACWAEAPSTARFTGYAARIGPRRPRRVGAELVLVTRLGRETLAVKAFEGVLVPSSDAERGRRGCYAVQGEKPSGRRPRVAITDDRGERLYEIGRATRLCVPVAGENAPDLVCHAVRLARTKPLRQGRSRPGTSPLATRAGTGMLRVGEPRELCVPTLSDPDPPDPDPDFTIEVTPRSLTVDAGTRTRLTATARFDDGHATDVTGTVAWSSSDEDVARIVEGSAGAVFLGAVGPGTAVVSATDPATGVRSSDSGGDATVEVYWNLEKLTMAPHAVTLLPGAHESYTVIGHFPSGVTRNLTQKVVYASSDPAVAAAPNTPGNRSRVVAVGAGTAVISATDPLSGLSTTGAANDATMRVVSGLSYITIKSNGYPGRPVGQAQRFTATGVLGDGSKLNLTQRCTWTSSEPSVATTPNTPGDRSRIVPVSPGATMISCTDPTSGIASAPTAFYTLGPLQKIDVWGGIIPREYPRTGESVYLQAVGRYAGGFSRNLTQEVVWATRDPELAHCPNEPGKRSRIVALAGGFPRIHATEPTFGIVSNDAVVPFLGSLTEVVLANPFNGLFPALPVGATIPLSLWGVFENGTRRVWPFELISSDPGVAAAVNGTYVQGIAPGASELTGRDPSTGLVSAPLTVPVIGELESITLTPATATRGIGEWESFTAIGNYPPAFTQNLTQFLYYASSDPTVVVADNEFGRRSRVRTVGAGTATITVTHGNGVSASAVVTVLPGTIERITIEPPTVVRNVDNAFSFTAIGHYPDGATLNVTQVVTWDTLVPDVARPTNEAGNRSRIVALATGTSGITARHPSGVSSHDTGGDATLVVKELASLTLTPASRRAPFGTVERYTLVGTFDDATTINLTQDGHYWTDDWAVARADNIEGDRSAVQLVAPGTTTVRAVFAGASGVSSVVGAFLEVVP